jgi:GDSL-like Lipase/Acylhydrolase family
MRQGMSRLLSVRHGSSPAVMIILLALATVAGESSVVSNLRGPSVANQPGQAPPAGYYEALIDPPRLVVAESNMPPAGWLPFSGDATGIVLETSTYLRWQMRPNLDLRWNGNAFRTNRLGYRTPEVELEKPKGTYRILVFGSSNTMGYGVNDDDIYTRHLERWLNEWAGPTRRVEVVNLAVAGDSPTRRLLRLQQEAGRYHPDWLICDASVLDSWLEDTHVHAIVKHGIPIPFPFVQHAVNRSGVKATDPMEAFRLKFEGESERFLDAVYAGWSAEARRLHTPLTVVVLPRADSKAKSPRVFELIASLANKHGLDRIDLSGIFDHREVEEFRNSEWDKHPSPRGHQLIFEGIRDALLSRGGLPGSSPTNDMAFQSEKPE